MTAITILTPAVAPVQFTQDQIDQFQARYNYLKEIKSFWSEIEPSDEELYELETLKTLLLWIADSHDLG